MKDTSTVKLSIILAVLINFLLLSSSSSLSAACSRPDRPTANNIDNNSVTIRWSSVSNAIQYKVIYKINGTRAWTVIYPTSNQVNLDQLQAGTTYRVRVKSICNAGSSRYSRSLYFTTTTGICPVPSGLFTLGIGSHQATLTWIQENEANSYDTRHREVGSATWINTNSINTNLVIAEGLSPSTDYEFQVRSGCAATNSAFSASAFFSTPENVCTTPTGLNVQSVGPTTATINWNPVGGTISYSVLYRPLGTTEWISRGSASNQISLDDLFPNTPYELQVQSECTLGGTGFSAPLFFTTNQLSVCQVPGNLNATQISATAATHHWNAIAGALDYTVRRRIAGTTNWNFEHTTIETSLQTFALSSGTTYEFQVSAKCAIGSSAFSASAFYTTLEDIPCDNPNNLSVVNITPSSAQFSWGAVSGAFQYTLQYRIVGNNTWISQTTSSAFITRSGLSSSSTYEWRVGALCTSGGTISFSTISTFSTPDVSTCPVPSGLFVLGINTNQATLLWTSNPEALNYDVRYRATSSGTWLSIDNIGTNLVIATSLSTSTQYEFQVRSNCASGTSAFSNSRLFTTLAAYIAPDDSSFKTQYSLHSFDDSAELLVFPNPSWGEITLEYYGRIEENTILTIYDQMGKTVRTKAILITPGNNKMSLDLADLSEGMYIIQLKGRYQTLGKKLIVK